MFVFKTAEKQVKESKTGKVRYNFTKANIQNIKLGLNNNDWEKDFELCNAQESWTIFHSTLFELISSNTPVCKASTKKKNAWFNSEIKVKVTQKSCLEALLCKQNRS